MNVSPDFAASPSDADTLERLRLRLGQAAEAEGLLDVAYTTVDSPVGAAHSTNKNHTLRRFTPF